MGESCSNGSVRFYKKRIGLALFMHLIFAATLCGEGILFFVLHLYFVGERGAGQIDYKFQTVFYFLNYFACFIIVFVGAFWAKVSTRRLEQELHRAAIDELTGVYNREYFFDNVERILKKSEGKYYLVCTNISGFKFFNEIFGKRKGDEVLKTQAMMLRERENSYAAYGRLVADEFGMLISEQFFCEKILLEHVSAMQEKFSSHLYCMHVYAGIYEIEDHNESAEVMCEKIRVALDTIKGNYDRNLVFYNEEMLKASAIKRKIVGGFEKALKEDEFCIYLQPQVAEEGKVLGAEALVRWKHPEEGVISPGEFVPVLEETSLITKLDYFVWEQAARLLRKWKKEGREWLYISVNVSAMDFLCLDICQTFMLLVQKYDINPVNLKIEITESVFMNEAKTQIDTLNRLQEYGFEIEIDDFGSGYSSLNMLKDIMADVMKIDMGFLLETVHEERSWSILQGIVNLAERLEMRTVAEGVETECQKKKLVDIGCNVFQEYYFAKPMPTEEFTKRYLC